MKVMLDAGHGGADSGAVKGKYKEKDFTLIQTLMLKNYIEKKYCGIDVVLTRAVDESRSLEYRANLANEQKVDLFLSMHINAGGGTGFESYVYNGSVPSTTIERQELIHSSIMDNLNGYGVRDRGMKRADFYVLRKTNMHAILLENLFIDTNNDLEYLKNVEFNQDLIVGIAKGIAQISLL